MTLLFFIRSPAGNTDAVTAPDVARHWDYDDERERRRQERKREREENRAIRHAEKQLKEAFAKGAELERKRKKRRREEELLMMLFMHEFDDHEH